VARSAPSLSPNRRSPAVYAHASRFALPSRPDRARRVPEPARLRGDAERHGGVRLTGRARSGGGAAPGLLPLREKGAERSEVG